MIIPFQSFFCLFRIKKSTSFWSSVIIYGALSSYLHSTCNPQVAHSNLKASNILLDEDFVPRLCDCGLAVLKPLTSNSVKLKVHTSKF